jgi:hypothetical protein
MSYWAVKINEPKIPEVQVPELTSSDLKIAVAKYRADRNTDGEHEGRTVKVLNYEAVPMLGNRAYHLRVVYSVNQEQFNVKFLLKLVRDAAPKTEKETFRKELVFFGCIMPKVLQFLPYHHSKVLHWFPRIILSLLLAVRYVVTVTASNFKMFQT